MWRHCYLNHHWPSDSAIGCIYVMVLVMGATPHVCRLAPVPGCNVYMRPAGAVSGGTMELNTRVQTCVDLYDGYVPQNEQFDWAPQTLICQLSLKGKKDKKIDRIHYGFYHVVSRREPQRLARLATPNLVVPFCSWSEQTEILRHGNGRELVETHFSREIKIYLHARVLYIAKNPFSKERGVMSCSSCSSVRRVSKWSFPGHGLNTALIATAVPTDGYS